MVWKRPRKEGRVRGAHWCSRVSPALWPRSTDRGGHAGFKSTAAVATVAAFAAVWLFSSIFAWKGMMHASEHACFPPPGGGMHVNGKGREWEGSDWKPKTCRIICKGKKNPFCDYLCSSLRQTTRSTLHYLARREQRRRLLLLNSAALLPRPRRSYAPSPFSFFFTSLVLLICVISLHFLLLASVSSPNLNDLHSTCQAEQRLLPAAPSS